MTLFGAWSTFAIALLWFLALSITFNGLFLVGAFHLTNTPDRRLCSQCRKDKEALKDIFDILPAEKAAWFSMAFAIVLAPLGPLAGALFAYRAIHECPEDEETRQP